MYQRNLKVRISAPPFRSKTIGNGSQAMLLTNKSKTEVPNFLAERPLHTVAMTGFIRDNELVSPANRGAFYGVRNDEGKLEGVALIGHATLMETRTQRAVHAFAEVAQKCSATHMILGESNEQDECQPSVLVVDDEAAVRELLCDILEREGFRVYLAEGGREALELFELASSMGSLPTLACLV